MAKKKHHPKKHAFKSTAPVQAATVNDLPATPRPKAAVAQAPLTGVVTSRDLSYVAPEMRRVGLLFLILLIVELALWGLLDFSPYGQAIYDLVRL